MQLTDDLAMNMNQLPKVLALLPSLLLAGCGGTSAVDHGGAPACSSDPVYVGPALHTRLPVGTLPPVMPVSMPPNPMVEPMPHDLAASLDARVDQLLLQTGAPAINAAMDVPGLGHWALTRGLARVSPLQAATDATWFYWASVAKSLTAVLVLQLVDEDRLRLDDRLSTWYPQVPNADLITIEQLLTHTSGLATNPLTTLPAPATLDAWLVAANATPAIACPGTIASYSNIGYALLGRIVQAVEKQPFDAVLQRRIAGPLGLAQLRALRTDEDQVANLATPHNGREPTVDPGEWLRLGAGNVVARARDAAAVWRAILEGTLLRRETVSRQWSALYPILDNGSATPNTARTWFGQGVMLMEWIDGSNVTHSWLGHLGGVPSANALVAYDVSMGAYVAVAVNSEVSAAAVGNALLDVLAQWRTTHGYH